MCGYLFIRTFLVTPKYTYTEEFVNDTRGYLFKAVYLTLAVQISAFKYYIPFIFFEITSIASGLGVTIEDEKIVTYNHERSVNIWGVESAFEIPVIIKNWNISLAKWLKYYVYCRLINSNTRWLPALATFIVSSLIHGIMPRLWFFYIQCFFLDITYKNLAKIQTPSTWSLPVKVLSYCYSRFGMAYIGAVFVFKDVDKCWLIFSAFNHLPTLVMPALALISALRVPKKLK